MLFGFHYTTRFGAFLLLLYQLMLFRFYYISWCFFVLAIKHHGIVIFYLEISSSSFTTVDALDAPWCSWCFFWKMVCKSVRENNKKSKFTLYFTLCSYLNFEHNKKPKLTLWLLFVLLCDCIWDPKSLCVFLCVLLCVRKWTSKKPNSLCVLLCVRIWTQ